MKTYNFKYYSYRMERKVKYEAIAGARIKIHAAFSLTPSGYLRSLIILKINFEDSCTDFHEERYKFSCNFVTAYFIIILFNDRRKLASRIVQTWQMVGCATPIFISEQQLPGVSWDL